MSVPLSALIDAHPMTLIDTHTHLYLEDFKDDQAEMIQRALDRQVKYMLLPHIDSHTSTAMHDMARRFPDSCIPMMGLHPTSVKENYRDELEWVEKNLQSGKYCAIGEVGIDLYWDTTFQMQQEEVFRREIELAGIYDLPLVIHTRNSLEVALEILKTELAHRQIHTSAHRHIGTSANPHIGTSAHRHIGTLVHGVFHCFPGTVEQAEEITAMGFYLGIGGVVTYKNSLMAKVVQSMPLQHLVLETDAPFLTPVPKRGMRNESAFVYYVAQKIAEIKGISVEEVTEVTTGNAKKLFRLE